MGGTPGGSGVTTPAATWLLQNGNVSADSISGSSLFPVWIPNWSIRLALAAIVIVLTFAGARLVVNLLGRRVAQRFKRPSITRTVLRGIRGVVYAFGFVTVLGIYDISLGDITLSVAVFSAVVGVVLAPIVGSIISGVFLLADQPYEIGDMVEIVDTGQRGFVEDITLRYTKLMTLDNTFLVLPNGEMRNRDVANYSAEDTRIRQALDVVVTYEGDLAEARSIVERAARDVDTVIEGGPDIRIGAARYPAAPTCYIDTFGDHGVHLRLRYWLREPYKLLATRSKVQTNVWSRLEDADVTIAYPHQHHVFDETSGQVGVAVGGPSANRPGPEDRHTAVEQGGAAEDPTNEES